MFSLVRPGISLCLTKGNQSYRLVCEEFSSSCCYFDVFVVAVVSFEMPTKDLIFLPSRNREALFYDKSSCIFQIYQAAMKLLFFFCCYCCFFLGGKVFFLFVCFCFCFCFLLLFFYYFFFFFFFWGGGCWLLSAQLSVVGEGL